MKGSKLLTYLIPAVLLIVFWLFYSVVNYPLLDSDHAIQIIMIDHLRLPHDLYFMGQDRIGSILPFIGWLFYQLGFSPIMAMALTQCLLFMVVAIILFSLFQKRTLAWAAIIILVFPLPEFDHQVMPGQPYPGHLLILFLAILVFKKSGWKNPVYFLFLGFGIWASGLFAANILAGLIIVGFSIKAWYSKRFNTFWIIKGMLWSIPGFALLWWAKITATTTDSNYTQSSWVGGDQLLENLGRFKTLILERATFQHPDLGMGIAFWLFILLAILSGRPLLKQKISSWSWFFILSGFITAASIIFSEWAYRMGLPLRYFSIAYLQILWGILLALDKAETKSKSMVTSLVVLNALTISLSGIISQHAAWRNPHGRIRVQDAYALSKNLQTEGVLGSYWTVYLIEAFHPEEISAMVDENGINRDYDAMKHFLQLDSVTIIQNAYLAQLADSVYDHGVYYRKAGPVKKAGELESAVYYKPATFLSAYDFNQLKHSRGSADPPASRITFCPAYYEGNIYAIYGPFVTLPAGAYRVCFDLTTEEPAVGSYIDVFSMGKELGKVDLTESDDHCIHFSLQQPTINVEFRVIYKGKGVINFKKIELQKTR